MFVLFLVTFLRRSGLQRALAFLGLSWVFHGSKAKEGKGALIIKQPAPLCNLGLLLPK